MRALAFLVPAIVLLLLVPAPGDAAEVSVPGDSVDAIGAAVASAGEGGTVTLEPGNHVLTATVTVAVANVTVTAKPGAVLLGRAEGGRLVLFAAEADGFRLTGVPVGPDPANGADLAVVEAGEVSGLEVSLCEAAGIVQLVNAGGASGVLVERNEVAAVEPRDGETDPSGLVVIRAAGPGETRILRNRLEGPRSPGTAGIEILPPADAVYAVERNRIFGFVDGIYGEGAGLAVIEKNQVERCTNGINIAPESTVTDWQIKSNKVVEVLTIGIYVGDGDGCVVADNRVLKAGGDGVNVAGVFLTVKKNRCRLNGDRGLYGSSDSSDYERNKAKRNGSGVRVEGEGNRMKRNLGSKNLGDGVISTGGNVNAEGNRGRKNGGVQVSIQ